MPIEIPHFTLSSANLTPFVQHVSELVAAESATRPACRHRQTPTTVASSSTERQAQARN
jgi:hypothetical protein